MEEHKFSISERIKSFNYAFNGLKVLLKEEHNSRIHFIAAICVLIAGVIFKLNTYEWMAILFAIGFVITLELINTSIENIADFISPDKHTAIKKIKDMAAAGVLVGAITALIIGLLVFIPKIIALC